MESGLKMDSVLHSHSGGGGALLPAPAQSRHHPCSHLSVPIRPASFSLRQFLLVPIMEHVAQRGHGGDSEQVCGTESALTDADLLFLFPLGGPPRSLLLAWASAKEAVSEEPDRCSTQDGQIKGQLRISMVPWLMWSKGDGRSEDWKRLMECSGSQL